MELTTFVRVANGDGWSFSKIVHYILDLIFFDWPPMATEEQKS